jgi:hypothetical protein
LTITLNIASAFKSHLNCVFVGNFQLPKLSAHACLLMLFSLSAWRTSQIVLPEVAVVAAGDVVLVRAEAMASHVQQNVDSTSHLVWYV